MNTRPVERIALPDGTSIEGPLIGDQIPRLFNVPKRHEIAVPGCPMCALEGEEGHDYGCGDGVASEVLDWAQGFGYALDPWQKWCLRHMLGRHPNGLWSSPDCVLIVSRQNGKGCENVFNKIYTRKGWKNFLSIAVGDEVIGSDGRFTKVQYLSPIFVGRDCYEVEFTDGTKRVVDFSHLWHVSYKGKAAWQDLTTEYLAERVGNRRQDNDRMEYNWRVRCDTVPDLPEAELPIDPYLLGYWLGDGDTHNSRLTVGTEDYPWVLPRVYRAGARKSLTGGMPEGKLLPSATGHMRYRIYFSPIGPMKDILQDAGLKIAKQIPEMYLTASIAQRKALLAGLMDSDGSITCNNKTPQCEFSTSIPELAATFHRLARSLGIRVIPKIHKSTLNGKHYKDRTRFLFTAPFNPFEMPRKADLWRPPASKRHELMSIVAIRSVESVPTRCIKIANPDGVYLTGELFTPTHNTILEVREMAGIFLLQEELIIHTAHQFKTSVNHFGRLKNFIHSYPSLERKVARIAGSHGEESIELKPRPVIIFGSGGKEITRRRSCKLQFHARSGSATSRGFSCDCLVYDEAMILTDEQVGASMPTMSAMPNPQMIYAASAGLEDGTVSAQLAKMRKAMKDHDPDTFGAEWSVNPHDESCPRDEVKGRPANYYIVCDKHDDRDDPRSWARANPGMGYRITPRFTQRELTKMPAKKFDIERLAIGNWPLDEEPWEVISKPAWKILQNEDPGFPTPPMVVGIDVAEDGSSATVMCAWEHQQKRTVVEMPREGGRTGTEWLMPWLIEKCKKWKPLAIAIPKSGPAAAIIDAAVRQWGDRVYLVGPGEEAAAFAFFIQQVKSQKLWHFGEEKAPTLWHAIGKATTRVVGDGGKAWCRRDSEADITPVTGATNAAYVLNKKRRSYDLSKSIA